MTADAELLRLVAALMSEQANADVRVVRAGPINEGWSASFGASPWQWVWRCTLASAANSVPATVIVKTRRPVGESRTDLSLFHNELAALRFLNTLDLAVAPRLLAADERVGVIVMQDLGMTPALEDLLTAHDATAAEIGYLQFARTLAQMHAATMGRADDYYALRGALGAVDVSADRTSILGMEFAHAWRELRAVFAQRPDLPAPDGLDAQIDAIAHDLALPGPFLAFTNGDTCPANCRILPDGMRFIDFEHAAFRHALLDASALYFPFPACGCWSRIPGALVRRAEDAYRAELAHRCPIVLDSTVYDHGLAVGCAFWAIMRAKRLSKLERISEPHPMGFSWRGQLIDTIAIAAESAQRSRTLRALATWLFDLHDALRLRWPDLPFSQPVYPAFRAQEYYE